MVSIAGCAQTVTAPTSAPNSADISAALGTGGVWKLQSLTRPDSTTVTVSQPDRFTLELLDSTGRTAVRADCNRGAGPFTLNGSALTVGLMAVTRAYCSSAPFDDEYLKLLSGDSVLTLSGTSLQLSSSRGTLRFTL